jgi:hypothetical protein
LAANTAGVIPHGTTIAKYAKLLEQYTEKARGLDIIVEKTSHGPSLTFDLDNLFGLITCGYGLVDKFAATGSGHKPVMIAHTLDGAMLTSHLGHVTAGIKIVDPRAIDPMTGIPIGLSGLFPTRDLCYPAHIVFGKIVKVYTVTALVSSSPSSMEALSSHQPQTILLSYPTFKSLLHRTCPPYGKQLDWVGVATTKNSSVIAACAQMTWRKKV